MARASQSVSKRLKSVSKRLKASQSVSKRLKASQSVSKRLRASQSVSKASQKRLKASRVTLHRARNHKTLPPLVPYNKKKIPKKKTPLRGSKEKGSVTLEHASLPTGWQTVRPQKPRGLASRNPPMRPIGFATIGAGIPGRHGRKIDWLATWRNWCRKAAEQRSRGPRGQPDRPGGFAAVRAEILSGGDLDDDGKDDDSGGESRGQGPDSSSDVLDLVAESIVTSATRLSETVLAGRYCRPGGSPMERCASRSAIGSPCFRISSTSGACGSWPSSSPSSWTNGRSGPARARPRQTTTAFVQALQDLPPWCVAEAAERFGRGLVAGHNIAWPPSAAQVHAEARKIVQPWRDERAAILEVLQARIAATPPPPEERARVIAGLGKLRRDVAASAAAAAAEDRQRADRPDVFAKYRRRRSPEAAGQS